MLNLNVNNRDALEDIIITEDTILKIDLDNCSKEINIDVMDDMCLEVLEMDNHTSNVINYNLRSNAQVIVNKLARDCSDTTNVTLSGDNASIKYYSNIMNFDDNIYTFKTLHKANCTSSDIYNYCVNFTNSSFKFLIDGKIERETAECYCNQDNKIIDMANGDNAICPNLLVDNDMINANHSAYIGKFKKDIVFYMQSRGLSKRDCDFLLIKGFLLGKMQLDDRTLEEYTNFVQDNVEW